MKNYLLRTIVFLLIFGTIAFSSYKLVGAFEPSPKIGQVWVPSFVDNQPHWSDFWDTKVVDVKDGYVRVVHKGTYNNLSLFAFHCKYDFQREN
jgi:hypothetical protein